MEEDRGIIRFRMMNMDMLKVVNNPITPSFSRRIMEIVKCRQVNTSMERWQIKINRLSHQTLTMDSDYNSILHLCHLIQLVFNVQDLQDQVDLLVLLQVIQTLLPFLSVNNKPVKTLTSDSINEDLLLVELIQVAIVAIYFHQEARIKVRFIEADPTMDCDKGSRMVIIDYPVKPCWRI